MSQPKISVLIVDDVAFNQKMISNLLENQGFFPMVATTGEQAIEMCRVHRFNAILMDVNLPGVNGVEATKRIRSELMESTDTKAIFQRPVIIGLSAHAGSRDRERFLAAGMDDCLAKPFDLNELVALINRLVSADSDSNSNRLAQVADTSVLGVSLEPGFDPEVLDYPEAMQRLCGKDDLFWQFVDVFREDIPEMLSEAKSAANEQDLAKLEKTAHRIRGIAANLGCIALTEAARSLEVGCASTDLTSQVITNTSQLLSNLETQVAVLEQAFVANRR